jgi:hypothetical protein
VQSKLRLALAIVVVVVAVAEIVIVAECAWWLRRPRSSAP